MGFGVFWWRKQNGAEGRGKAERERRKSQERFREIKEGVGVVQFRK